MPLLLFSALISSLFLIPKAFAHNDMKLIDVVRMTGWLQSTCTAYKAGLMNSSNAKLMLEVSLSQIKKNHSVKTANVVRQQTLEKYPHCKEIMP